MSSIWSNVPITCLAWVGHNYLMAGQGQALLLLDKYGKVWDRHEVFRGSSVHQIHGDSREGSRWLVAGSKSCALVTVRDNKLCMEVEEQILSDWIMHCLVLDTVYLLTAHNRLTGSWVKGKPSLKPKLVLVFCTVACWWNPAWTCPL